MDADIFLLVEEIPDRVPNRRLLEQPGRHLVQQRLEGVVVVLVDDHDVDVALAELLGGADAGEAAAQDEDAGTAALRVGSSAHGEEESMAGVASPTSSQADERVQARARRLADQTRSSSSDDVRERHRLLASAR